MIQKLRKKLILVSMLSLFAVLFLIVSVSTTVSYLQMAQSADSTLNMLARNDGKFPKGPGTVQALPRAALRVPLLLRAPDR